MITNGFKFKWADSDEIMTVTFVSSDDYYCLFEGNDGYKDIMACESIEEKICDGEIVSLSSDSNQYNISDKLSWLLEQFYNLFHADMICRAILDDSVSVNDFINGVEAIGMSEAEEDSDEFAPEEFINV